METLGKSLVEHSGTVFILLLLLTILLLSLTSVLLLQVHKLRQKWKTLLTGSTGKSLEHLLEEHLRSQVAVEEELREQITRIGGLERKMSSAKRYAGLVRFDAFGDVGGLQSFALAVYDERGDGFVLSSLIGRADCRVYCKMLSGGKADRDLSSEELKAIEEAARPQSKFLTI